MSVTINVGGTEETLAEEHIPLYGEAFKQAGEGMEEALSILMDPEFVSRTGKWKKDNASDGIEIHYMDTLKGRFFSGRVTLPLPAHEQVVMFWDDLEKYEWNPDVKFAKKIQTFSKMSEVTHYASNDVMMVSSREFVSARLLRKIGDAHVISARSVKLKHVPEVKGTVRAELHLGAGIYKPNPDDPENSCIYDYIVNIDLKGMLIKSVINTFMGRIIYKDLANVRRHTEELKKLRGK